MIKITSTNDVIIVEGDELTRHYPNNGTLVIPKNSTIVLLDEASEMVLFKSASNYDTLFTGILGSILIEDEIVTRENIIEKFNAISNVNVGGNVDLFEVVQSLPTENISDNKVYLVLDSNGSEGNTYVEYLYVNGQWEELGKFKVNVDLSGYALKTDILSANTDSRYTTYEVQNPVLSGKTILLQNELTDSRKYHTLGFDKTYSTTSNGLLNYNTPLYRDSNEYNCPQWDGNTIRFTYQSGMKFKTRLTIPYTYNGIKYVTHIDSFILASMFQIQFHTINDQNFTDYQSVQLRESEIYKAFGAYEIFTVKIGSKIENYDSNSGTAFYDYMSPGNNIEITVRNFPLNVNSELIIETPRFYISENNVLMGDIQTESETSEHPERLNDYIRYANDVKAYILTDKNTTFKTINGEQITGNGNIEVATKAELATKQDTISDLEAIRSGASKGATALQAVPSTYALKTDILSAKTDSRYTDYDVENPLLSGNTILLQNEVTDSRKYHTFGYDKTVVELVKSTNHINVTRGDNNVPSMETDIESGISLNTNSNGFHNLSGSVTIPIDSYYDLTTILHYEVSHVERDSEGNVTGGSETSIVDVTYDPNTKVLSFPIDSFLFAQITRTDTNKELFGGNNDGYAYQENGRQCYSFEQHPLQEGGTLIWNPYYSDQYFWNYSVEIDVNGLKEVQVSTDNKPERLNDYIRYANDVKAYILTDKNTTFKTINGQQITGNGNIEIEASANNVPTLQTTPKGTTSNYIYSSGEDNNYSVIADISTSISYSTDKASIATLKRYWGSQSVNGYDMWSINAATTSRAGLMSSSDKSKLDGIDLTTKQDVLVSGTNIKTVNGTSLLGSGNIEVSADLSGYYTKAEIDSMIGGASTTITQINNLVV